MIAFLVTLNNISTPLSRYHTLNRKETPSSTTNQETHPSQPPQSQQPRLEDDEKRDVAVLNTFGGSDTSDFAPIGPKTKALAFEAEKVKVEEILGCLSWG